MTSSQTVSVSGSSSVNGHVEAKNLAIAGTFTWMVVAGAAAAVDEIVVGMPQVLGALLAFGVVCLKVVTRQLHVLLRHRPRSISRAGAFLRRKLH